MPEKPATIAAYAAGASLAAITLFYVFGPNFTIDGEDSNISGRKKGIVGLSNPANDCFINSVLQALAGLGELRVYLIRELHKRDLEGAEIYDALPPAEDLRAGQDAEKVQKLQLAPVTRALKDMLDGLNERPIYKKTISARAFVIALELAFRTRISRSQQDAQEFLQVVVELSPESKRLLAAASTSLPMTNGSGELSKEEIDGEDAGAAMPMIELAHAEPGAGSENGFPLEGMLESQIECQHCKYKYKPKQTSFVNLTLQVPQKSSATLSSCFDGLLKTEFIDDFRCERCQLVYTLEQKVKARSRTSSEKTRELLGNEIALLENAIENDPEIIPEGVTMPSPSEVPRRKIAKHMRITVFPKVIAIHLSRSIFDHAFSTKNAAKVSFPERLALGGILEKKWYKLLAIVCHKGSHNSGHYESFRRNHVYAPFSTPDAFRSYAQSRSQSQNPSTFPSPRMKSSSSSKQATDDITPLNISPVSRSPSTTTSTSSFPAAGGTPTETTTTSSIPSRPASGQTQTSAPHLSPQPPRSHSQSQSTSDTQSGVPGRAPSTSSSSVRQHIDAALPGDLLSPKRDSTSTRRNKAPTLSPDSPRPSTSSRFRWKKKPSERWWRISDEKIRECKTADVLNMQKEVYLLFYELERPSDEA
ncbi:Ubiquitin carboxyl-terminal hydrolase [Trichophyton equinum CBS 127.97]|uniref:Ubiquitin carboxyl-terminal hydrolase n=1 Tax=Trichophyton equinum (strain ATCC MYA-4606 / CBS 127.97) TaxID=559882 RepID=F2PHX2_TRIEC|nr:Ubiquitin carboxyl-terminal hydrolase [Trichophyton equinum CBS 127.97]